MSRTCGPVCAEPECNHLASLAGQGKWCTAHGLPKLDDAALAGVLSQYAADLADEGRGVAPQIMIEAVGRLQRAAEQAKVARADLHAAVQARRQAIRERDDALAHIEQRPAALGGTPPTPRQLFETLERTAYPFNQGRTAWDRRLLMLLSALVQEADRQGKLEPTLRQVISRVGLPQP